MGRIMTRRFPRLALGPLFLVVLGIGVPTRASIVIQSASVSNSVQITGVTEVLAIGTTQLGHQSDSLDFTGPPGVSATLRYEMTTPDPIGTGFAVHNFVRATVPPDGSTFAVAGAGFSIDFLVDATQDFLLFGQDTNFGRPLEGFFTFEDLTAGTTLFSHQFGDFSGPAFWEFTLLEGHRYKLSAVGDGFVNDPPPTPWARRSRSA